MNTCLLIIDVQNGFITGDTFHIPERLKNLIENYDFNHIVASQFINSRHAPHFLFTGWDRLMDENACELNEYVGSIAERVFKKSINSCFTKEFEEYIKDKEVQKLYLVGIDTDCCVLKTAFDCFDKIINFEVLTHYCASTGGLELHEAAIKIMLRSFGEKCIWTEAYLRSNTDLVNEDQQK